MAPRPGGPSGRWPTSWRIRSSSAASRCRVAVVRIVSLLPSATEIVYALGLGDQLDGVTFECDYPPEARSKPVVSDSALPQDHPLSAREVDQLVSGFQARGESIYALDEDMIQRIQPDVILTQDLCKVCA